MQIFRTMDQPEGGDYRALPGYSQLDQAAQTKVDEIYSNAYASRQSMGYKIATGIAFESAKKAMNEALAVKPASDPYPATGSWKDQQAWKKAHGTRHGHKLVGGHMDEAENADDIVDVAAKVTQAAVPTAPKADPKDDLEENNRISSAVNYITQRLAATNKIMESKD